MEQEWVNLRQVAEARGITVAQASALAGRERWPRVFRLHETLVLPPRPIR